MIENFKRAATMMNCASSSGTQRIIKALARLKDNEGYSVKVLAANLDLKHATVYNHLKKLVDAGLADTSQGEEKGTLLYYLHKKEYSRLCRIAKVF